MIRRFNPRVRETHRFFELYLPGIRAVAPEKRKRFLGTEKVLEVLRWNKISRKKHIFIRLCSIIYCIILYRIHYSIFKICLNDRICIRKDDANDLIVVLNLKIPGHIIHQII